jgi:hypothetical protein
MNTATVIFSNMGDADTLVLKYIWEGLPNVKVVEVNSHNGPFSKKVDEALLNEKDTLILCGHGYPSGLLSPQNRGEQFLVSERNVRFIKAKRIIGIWCYASSFAKDMNLNGFFSSMFISNTTEAAINGCFKSDAVTITREEILFGQRLNKLIASDTPMSEWKDKLIDQADMSIDIVRFNYKGLTNRG